MTADAAAEHAGWVRSRHDAVSGPTGNLALVGFVPVTAEPQRLDELPVTVHRVGDEQGVRVRASAADGVHLDATLVDGETSWARATPSGQPLLTWRHLSADAFSLDGSAYEIRIFSADAENRSRFERIDTYPYDPALVRPARFVREDTHAVEWEFTRAQDCGATKQVPGRVAFTLDGVDCSLTGFLDGDVLVITFADATTGAESYAPGRFLKVDLPQGEELTLDLNRAFIPPCGFSDFYSCPLPPPGNRLPVPVRGGERRVVWR